MLQAPSGAELFGVSVRHLEIIASVGITVYGMTMRAAIYLRQSLDRTGEAVAVARQREDCAQLCADKGWTAAEYVDNDTSASSGKKRPGYEQMLTDIEAGTVGAVVAWDLDRLHRRPVELEAFIDLADRHKLALATVSGDIDLGTPQGRLVARLKGSVARHEVEHKSARQVRAARQKAARGEPHWRKAFGYIDTPAGPQPDPATAPLLAEAYQLILAGGSLSAVCQLFRDAGAFGVRGGAWNPSTVSMLLRKAYPAGLREYRGEIVGPGTWPPIVDEQLWRAVQAVLNDPDRKKPGRRSVRRHLLTGVMACGRDGCEGRLGAQWHAHLVGGMGGQPEYRSWRIVYACTTCRRCSISGDHVQPLVLELVAGRLAQPDAADLVKADKLDAAEVDRVRRDRLTLMARLDQAAVDYADGILDGRGYQRARDRMRAQLDQLDAAEADQERLRVFDGIPLGTPEVAEAVSELAEQYPDRYRAIIDLLMSITVAPAGKGGRVFKPERVQVDWR